MKKAVLVTSALALLLTSVCWTALAKEQLTVWVTWAPAAEVVKEYNKIQDEVTLDVQLINVGNSDPNGKLTTAVAGGVSPNVILTWEDDLINFAVNGLIQPMDDYFNWAKVDQKNYVPASWEQAHYQGKAYGVPFCWDIDDLLFYNKQLLAESGYSEASVPQYLDELTAMQKRLTKVDGNGKYTQTGVRMFMEGWGYTPLTIMKSFGGEIWDPLAQRPHFVQPANIAAWTWIDEWWRQFEQAERGAKSFMSLGAAFYIGGDWNLNTMKKTIPIDDIGFTRMPYPRDGYSIIPGSGWAWMLPTGSKSKDETYKFIQWVTKSDINQRITAAVGILPADIRALKSKEIQATSMGVFARISLMEGNFIWQNPNPQMAKLAGILLNQVKLPIQARALAPAAALENAQKAAEALLSDFYTKMKK